MAGAPSWLRYNNHGTRNLPLSPQLQQALSFLPEMGIQAEVFSGGQPAIGSGLPRTGSTRHDHGSAADVFFYQNGRRLDWSNPQDLPVYQDIVRRGKEAGLTGFGAGPGYMQPGSMHIGFGNPGVWGAGGSSRNAPSWLAEAYGAAPAGAAPTMANMQAKKFDPVGEVMAAAPQGRAPTLAAMYGPAPAPAADPLAGLPGVPGVPAAPQGIAGLALMFAQQQAARNQQQADEQQAEQMRRAALFSPDSLAGLFGAA